MINTNTLFPFKFGKEYSKSVAYFSMEFAIDQSLKTYSGGLGFLAGSHMRSAYELKQNLVGISVLWKYGYYDQNRNIDNSMQVAFREQMYSFIEDTKIRFTIDIKGKAVNVAVFHLPAITFGSAPMFFLSTDIDGNDTWARSISYHLYDKDPEIKVAQCMLLGIGGAKFVEEYGLNTDILHFNEAHAISAVFYMLSKNQNLDTFKSRLRFTTHTPEEAGNEKHEFRFLYELGFFCGLQPFDLIKLCDIKNGIFNHTLAALKTCAKANGVSKLHGEVSRDMWASAENICEIGHITNAQNNLYWADATLEAARKSNDIETILTRKKELKKILFKEVANQVGKIFDPEVLTIIWARRFAAYKRPDLITRDLARFENLMKNNKIQIIWAGKPYPFDFGAIEIFNKLYYLSHLYPNMAVLTGHELALSKLIKDGSDVWLNNPIVTREASGTSGMTAAMNASLNLSTYDGWVCEFANESNSFVTPVASLENTDAEDLTNILDTIEQKILPAYQDKKKWGAMILQSMNDVNAFFDSDRMADEYYKVLYS